MKSTILTVVVLVLLLVGLTIYKHQRDASFGTVVDHPAETPDPTATPAVGSTAKNIAFKWDNGCNALPLKVASGTHIMVFSNEGAMGMATSGQPVWKCGSLYAAF